MNNEQQQIIGDAYKNYLFNSEWFPISSVNGGFIGTKSDSDEIMTQDLFINKCKTDDEFVKEWGLKIEERELSLSERTEYKKKRDGIARTFSPYTHQMLDGSNIPTKLITVIYNNEKIESYV